ncbi:MAG: SAM-dependent methyltransferase, partial [Desulfobacteraceae bacterium]|nr:SAM-dependent methyltransferase [Desulfobacteraceae bacterium]
MPEIIDRKEGRGLFGADPNNYNEIRPPYPEQIYEFLLTTGALHA